MTNTTASIILKVLLVLPPHQEDIDWPYRDAELQPLAEAIAQTAKTPQEAAGSLWHTRNRVSRAILATDVATRVPRAPGVTTGGQEGTFSYGR